MEFDKGSQPEVDEHDNIISGLNRLASVQRIIGPTEEANFGETRDMFNRVIERDFTGLEQSKRINKSAKGETSGLFQAQVDASTSVLNNFLSVGTGDQTVNRLIPAPTQFGGKDQKQAKVPSYEFSVKGRKDSVGSVNNNKDQGGISE